jgi:DNA-binding beta-propeller fold protein YncE
MVERNLADWVTRRPAGFVYRVSCGVLLLAGALLTACAGPTPLHGSKPSAILEWPQQTTGPKVAWVKTIANSLDAGITKGFWTRVVELITGADDRRILRPYGVLFDSAERLYIADHGAGVIHFMDTKAGKYTVIGGNHDTALRTPIGLAVDGQGLLYITDSTAAALFRFDPAEGSLVRLPVQGVLRPTGIVYNKVNNLLYIVDTIGNQVVCVNTAGKEQFRFGATGDEAGEFNRPTDIAVDKRGQLYLTDALNYKIRIFTMRGEPVGRFGAAGDAMGDLNKPKGVAVDSDGHIYVSDALLDTIQVFDAAGHLLNSFGGRGTANGALWMPSGLFIDSQDYIFVADTFNQRIQVFRYTAGAPGPALPSGRAITSSASEKP